jgi:hypothetical protein
MNVRFNLFAPLVGAALVLVLAGSAGAGPPGKWTQITHAHNGTVANLGLARARDGTLHVLWAGPKFRPFTSIFDTPITPAGAVGRARAVLSGWSGVHPPAAVTAPDGSIHVIVSGQRLNSNTDPNSGLNEIAGPGSWKLGAHAFGSFPITEASNANVRTAVLKNGQLVSVWATAATMLFQTGVDPATPPQNITPPKNTIGAAEIAADPASGEVVIAYHDVSSGADFLRRILPALGAPQTIPQAKVDPPPIAARAGGGGVYTAYTPDGAKVVLLRVGSRPRSVPVPKGASVLTAGLAPGPDGRLWVFYGNERTTYVTRTSRHVSSFEPVQALKSPPKTVQYFRLEGEGSAGPLDLFADITVDGQSKDGSYHTQVHPKLSLRASKSLVKNKKGAVTAVRITVHVNDAGDPVKGAKVTGLPGGSKATGATGTVAVTVPAGKHGTFALTAKKAGYVVAKGRVSL